jgi:NagD protein
MSNLLPRYRGYAFDLDGTLYLGDALLPGAEQVVRELRESGSRVVFVTNKPLETTTAYAEKLTKLGIPATADDIVSAIDALILYLRRNHSGKTILPVAENVAIYELKSAGFEISENPEKADVVVVSFDRTFDYDKLNRAYQAVKRGAVIVATNPDPYCPTPDGGLPDCAAMLAAIEACTGAKAEAIVGKPSVYMAEAFLDKLQVPANEAAMVGDRILTDVAMGLAAQMSGILVLSGATTLQDATNSEINPTFIIEDVRGLLHN